MQLSTKSIRNQCGKTPSACEALADFKVKDDNHENEIDQYEIWKTGQSQ